MKIKSDNIYTRLENLEDYINDDNDSAELIISDGIYKFFSHPKVKEFYNDELGIDSITRLENKKGISSSILLDHKNNQLDLNQLDKDLSITDINIASNMSNLFGSDFQSILIYFFGTKFNYENISKHYFYFRNNKIILFFRIRDPGVIVYDRYVCVISFQEFLNKENIITIFKELLQKNMPVIKDESRKINIFTYINGEWQYTKCTSRSYDTIYLPLLTKKLITSEMNKFLCFEKIFKENGIPYKKGFLFYGPPGTGKTSLVKSLAYTYDIPIYIFDINNDHVNDENISKIINSMSGCGNRILLFEDIDAAFSNKEELKYQLRDKVSENLNKDSKINTESKKFLTYSGLLNALDGVLSSQHGTIIIMTTNYKEKLGPALIRPGRIDFCLELSFCDRYQIIEMTKNMIIKSYYVIKKNYDELTKETKLLSNFLFKNQYNSETLSEKVDEFANNLMQGSDDLSKVKPCELQTYILRHIENVDNIFDNYKELLLNT